MTHLLEKHVMGAPKKILNVVQSKGYDEENSKRIDEEIRYFANYSMGSRPAYQWRGGNKGLTYLERELA